MIFLLALLVVACALAAVVRRMDVRLVLALGALALGGLGGDLRGVVVTFLRTMANEQFVVPICTAVGFAYALRQSGCDQHFVHLLAGPVRRVRFLLLPGAVAVGVMVNVPVVSQAGAAATVGPVLLPLLRTGGVAPPAAGAALLLGVSIGGELLNPGAPEYQTIDRAAGVSAPDCVHRAAPLLAVHVGVATILFWLIAARQPTLLGAAASPEPSVLAEERSSPDRVNLLKAAVPLLPLALLFVAGPPFGWLPIDRSWLVGADEGKVRAEPRLIGLAMLVGVVAAALVTPSAAGRSARSFFEGAGYAYTHVISLIVCAEAFGAGLRAVGLGPALGGLIAAESRLLLPLAIVLPLGFAFLCGSGFAATAALFGLFVAPSRATGTDPATIGVIVSLAAAAGRTLSPVAAVKLLSASMAGADPGQMTRLVVLPLLASLAVVLLVAALL